MVWYLPCALTALYGSLASYLHFRLSTLGPDGKWPSSEVDLTTGCEARRASWPAQTHWRRIGELLQCDLIYTSHKNAQQMGGTVTMAGAWHGGAPSTAPWNNNTELRNATSLAMGYWISRDMGEQIACLDRGGTPACPCANPGNTLWCVCQRSFTLLGF